MLDEPGPFGVRAKYPDCVLGALTAITALNANQTAILGQAAHSLGAYWCTSCSPCGLWWIRLICIHPTNKLFLSRPRTQKLSTANEVTQP